MSVKNDDMDSKISEYHLMVEEVLGGMDILICRLESRIAKLETILGVSTVDERLAQENHLESLRAELRQFKNEATEGLTLAFRKLAEK